MTLDGIQHYFYGWCIFFRSVKIQRAKKHGKRQPWGYVLITARMQRWIVDGQHRGVHCPTRRELRRCFRLS